MRKLTTVLWATAAVAMAPSAFAQTATTAFDGNYRGVSRQLEGGAMGGSGRACALPDGMPAPLTIRNGVARAGSADNPLEGTVTPQGVLVMRAQRGGKFEGQIDAQGKAAGRLIVSCSYQYVWQRQ